MGNKLILFFAGLALLLVAVSPSFAQDQQQKPKLKGYIAVRPVAQVEERLPEGKIAMRCDHCGTFGVFDRRQLRPTSAKLLVPRLP